MYVQVPIGSRNPAIHNAYHTSLRPSSLFEPRHPSLKVVTSLGSCAIPCLPAKVCEGVQITRQIGRPAIHTPNETRFVCTNQVSHMIIHRVWDFACNDPSAGSPTETLLRLLLPLSGLVYKTFQMRRKAKVRIIHQTTQSVGATGGVYKGQGRNQHELMTRAY